MRVVISKKQAKALRYLSPNSDISEVFYGGAAGGGKSWLGCVWQISNRLKYPNTRGLIGRSKLKNLRMTTLKTFIEVWEGIFKYNSAGITMRINNSDNVIYFSNGSEIYLKDLFYYPSDPEFASLGSMEITDAFIDEGTEITEKAFNILKSRIRYNLIGGRRKILMSSNPAHNWVKFRYMYTAEGVPVKLKDFQKVIIAKVQDNPDKEFVRNYIEGLLELPEADRRRLLDGDWMYNPNENPFLYEFRDDENLVDHINLVDEERILFSFDFNFNPTTCTVSQLLPYDMEDGGGLNFVTEFAVKGGTSNLCDAILKHFDMDSIRHLVRVTGDHSGVSRSSVAGNHTDYAIIKDKFQISNSQLIDVSTANLKHVDSQNLCNYALYHLPVRISRRGCPALIQDLKFAQMIDGKLLKDESKGFGMHLLDCFRYDINAHFLNKSHSVKKFSRLINPEYYKRRL